MSERAVEFVADNAPYRTGESATFPAGRAAAMVAAGVARYPADAASASIAAAIETDPQAGKRTGQATRYAKKR